MTTNLFYEKYPLLASSYDGEYREVSSESYSALLTAQKSVLPKGAFYLNSKLHDSSVISLKQTANELCIQLNDFSTRCLADAFVERFSILCPYKKRIFPVMLTFHHIQRCSIAWINRNGKILPLQIDAYLPTLSDFLYDEATRVDRQHIAIGMMFSSKTYRRKKSVLLLEVESEALSFQESQRSKFLAVFGGDSLALFDAFWQQRQQGKSFDYSTASDFMTTHMHLLGRTC